MTIESTVMNLYTESAFVQSYSRIISTLLITTLLTGMLMIVDVNANSTFLCISLLLVLMLCFFVYSYTLRFPTTDHISPADRRTNLCNYLAQIPQQPVSEYDVEKDLPPSYVTALNESKVFTISDTLSPPPYHTVIKEISAAPEPFCSSAINNNINSCISDQKIEFLPKEINDSSGNGSAECINQTAGRPNIYIINYETHRCHVK